MICLDIPDDDEDMQAALIKLPEAKPGAASVRHNRIWRERARFWRKLDDSAGLAAGIQGRPDFSIFRSFL